VWVLKDQYSYEERGEGSFSSIKDGEVALSVLETPDIDFQSLFTPTCLHLLYAKLKDHPKNLLLLNTKGEDHPKSFSNCTLKEKITPKPSLTVR